jgi:hypothetical protein
MKNLTIYLLLSVFITFIISCSNDDDSSDNNTVSPELVCGEDVLGYSGTICCVTGSDLARPGETLSFTYSSNRNNSVFNWVVSPGSISIVSGENSQTVTIEFGSDFTNGIIKCEASGHLVCNAVLEITKQ